MKVKLPVQLSKVSSKADRSYTLGFNTRELLGEEAAILLDNLMKEGWIVFSPNDDIDVADIPVAKAGAGVEGKSSATRLRAVLFVYWNQQGKKGDFEDFYRFSMEGFIDHIKGKLDQ